MKKDSYQPGEPCWIDCGTDLDKGPTFYADLFGWAIEDMGEDAGGYLIASKAGGQVAGFGPQQSPGAPFWSVYFRTDDVAKTTELVRSNGGSVYVEGMEVLGAGFMAVYADPVGAAFSVWQPKDHKGFGEVDSPGTYCWAELVTTDLDASRRFYTDVFGLTAVDSSGEGDSMAYTEFKLDDRSVAGMMLKPEMMPAEVPPFWNVYFSVDDVDETIGRVSQLGGMTVAGPMDVSVGRFASCVDTAGAQFSIIKFAQS